MREKVEDSGSKVHETMLGAQSTEPAPGVCGSGVYGDVEDNRTLRVAVAVAVLFHAALLVVQLPRVRAELVQETKAAKVYVVEPVRFRPPPEPERPRELPEPRVPRIPVPDPTPDDPEPIPRDEDEPPPFELPVTDLVLVDIPEAPPDPEPTGPVPYRSEMVAPVKIFAPPPAYTEVARRIRLEGTVIVNAVIDTSGNVTDIEVIKGLGMGLSESTVAAVRTWRFEPALLNGRPVAVIYTLTVTFGLQ